MPRIAPVVPAESDLLCEGCGYILNGLPIEKNCPECGKPIEQSIGEHRTFSEFEERPGTLSFLRTTAEVVFTPKAFFCSVITQIDTAPIKRFEFGHRVLATVLFTAVIVGHVVWLDQTGGLWQRRSIFVEIFIPAFSAPFVYILLAGLTRLATWLSAIEAKYWGMRLPYAVVARGLAFHSAHYLPVGILMVTIVWGYQLLLEFGFINHARDAFYLYTLCGAVIVSAIYLFQTYWIAMRSMRYANR